MNRRESLPLTGMICLLLFAAFVFLYIYVFQSDMLFYAQHVFSNGVTTYQPLVGAVVITLLLVLAALLAVRPIARHLCFAPALYYVPSALALAALTDVHIVRHPGDTVFGNVWIVALVVLAVYVLVVRLPRRFPFYVPMHTSKDIIRNVCLNMLIMLLVFVGVLSLANTDETDHFELEAERALCQGNYEKAALVGKRQDCAGESLTTIRAFALSKCGEIGEHFFEYQVVGTSSVLLPAPGRRMRIFPEMRIYGFVVGLPSEGMDARECLRLLEKRGKLREEARGYLLTACLVDCDLDAFANYIKASGDSLTTLQKHYREALTLHNHLRSNPVVEYELPEMEADFQDFQNIIKNNPDKLLRENNLRDLYGGTYWFYYYFTSRNALTQSVSSEN